ncbi:hypothetical protein IOD13_14510 [Brevibacterium casei]|nr:hypothetical protein [Brevibacterium casei]
MPKKLALIPALALAIAGLGATPALADTAAADSAYSARARPLRTLRPPWRLTTPRQRTMRDHR